MKLVEGVGVYSKCEYDSSSRPYRIWYDMLKRCYNEKCQEAQPEYIGVTVHPAFHKFVDFVTWGKEQKGFGVPCNRLDKDILLKGNKVYSPDTCIFVHHEINTLFTKSNAVRGDLPIGVYFSKQTGRYVAKVSIDGVQTRLGFYDSPEAAFESYKKAKEAYIKVVAERHSASLDSRAYHALINYTVEITD
jgi:hypothetical protein